MNMEKLTTKSREALMAAHNLAVENSNTELRNIHVLAALLRQEDGLVPSILEKLGINRRLFENQVDQALSELPRVSGSQAQEIYNSREFSALLVEAARQAEAMQDPGYILGKNPGIFLPFGTEFLRLVEQFCGHGLLLFGESLSSGVGSIIYVEFCFSFV